MHSGTVAGYSTSVSHSIMMGGTARVQHQNCVIDYNITVVPVQSGLLLLKKIRVFWQITEQDPPKILGDFLFLLHL